MARFWRAFRISGGGFEHPKPPLGTPLISDMTEDTFVPVRATTAERGSKVFFHYFKAMDVLERKKKSWHPPNARSGGPVDVF